MKGPRSLEDLETDVSTEMSAWVRRAMSVTVRLHRDALHAFYVEDEESDMDVVYHALESHFGDRPEWIISGHSLKDIERFVKAHLWPYPHGDFIVQRWINDGLASVI